MHSQTLKVDEINMRWEETGEGTPVIFLHGIPTSPRLWRHVIPKISSARCLAWEMVGYGASIPEGRDRDISVGRQADYLASWMQAMGLDKAVLVGHDLGGGVAQIIAVRYPERVAGLVLMNAICYDSWPIAEAKVMRATGSILEKLPEIIFQGIFKQFIYTGHDRSSRARESFHEHWPYYAAVDGAVDFLRQIRSLEVRDTLAISDMVAQLDVPARLIWGAADNYQKIGYGYRLAHDLKGSLTRIEDGKHFIPEDYPEEVAQTVNDLLAGIVNK